MGKVGLAWAVSCPVGRPLKDANGAFQSCSGAGQCPSTHACLSGFCCPNKRSPLVGLGAITISCYSEAVCTAPKQFGTCSTYQTRFWFNAATQLCETLIYSGCKGNDNNFPDLLACQAFCRGVQRSPSSFPFLSSCPPS